MNLQEAELFFKQFNGHGFHMWRDEPTKYENFNKAQISDAIQEQWRQEIIQNFFEHLFDRPEEIWFRHRNLIDVIKETKTDKQKNCSKLLDSMEQFYSLDKKTKIIIIENMAGRTNPQEDGGCYLICVNTGLKERMHNIVRELMNFECAPDDSLYKRFEEAKNSYMTAYNKFKDMR